MENKKFWTVGLNFAISFHRKVSGCLWCGGHSLGLLAHCDDLCVDDIESAMLGVIFLVRAGPPKVDALVESLHRDGL